MERIDQQDNQDNNFTQENWRKRAETSSGRNRSFFGLLIVLAGVAWLLRRMGMDFIPDWIFTWPMILIVIGMCHNGFEGVKLIQELQPDVVFLDVQMPKISGLEMLELLDEIPPVIFTTAFDEYAVSAFEANAIDYLLKPFSKERFNQSIEKLKSRSESLIPDISQLQQQASTRIV